MTPDTPNATQVAAALPSGARRLHRKLSPFAVLLLTLSCLSPVVSIYGVGGEIVKSAGTAAAGLFLLGIGVAAVFAMVYAELASAYPYAGGDYVGIGHTLGPAGALASLAVWTVSGGPAIAFGAKVVAVYIGELWPAAPAGAVTFGALLGALAIALLAVRTGALVTGVFLVIEMAAVLVLVAAGFASPERSLAEVVRHPQVLDTSGALVATSFGAITLGAVAAAYATCGGNQAIVFGEELRDPHRHMGRVLLLAALTGALATALPVVAVVLGARDLPQLLGSPAPMAAFVEATFGKGAAKALSAAVALAVFNANIVITMFYGRLFFSLGRDELFPPRVGRVLATVHEGTGVPRAATLLAGAYGAACCLLDSHVLITFMAGMLPYLLALVSLAVLVGRRDGKTGSELSWRAPRHPAAPVLGLVVAIGLGIAALQDSEAGRPSLLLQGAVVAAALAWYRFVLQRRPQGWRPRLPDGS